MRLKWPHNISVRMTTEQIDTLRRWAAEDPADRGMGHVLRRLIDEEVRRELEREGRIGTRGPDSAGIVDRAG